MDTQFGEKQYFDVIFFLLSGRPSSFQSFISPNTKWKIESARIEEYSGKEMSGMKNSQLETRTFDDWFSCHSLMSEPRTS